MANGIVIAISKSVPGIFVGISSAINIRQENNISSAIFTLSISFTSANKLKQKINEPHRETTQIYIRTSLDDDVN